MASNLPPRSASALSGAPDERTYEVRSELALKLARLGWAVRAEGVDLTAGGVIECVRADAAASTGPRERVRFPVTDAPVALQVELILAELRTRGWDLHPVLSGGSSRAIGSMGFWCVPD